MEEFVARAEGVAPGRAARLFDELNDRYRRFAGQLPRPLGQVARQYGTYAGYVDESPFDGIGRLNPVLAGTPWLFWELFSVLEDEPFLSIAEAGMYLVLASVLLDHVLDGHSPQAEITPLLHQALYASSLARYRALFPPAADFWHHFDRLSAAHLLGLATELEARADPRILTEDGLRTAAYGKVSPIIITIAALIEGSSQPSLLEPIEASLKQIAVASQLLDDIGDWQEDASQGHLTYFLTRQAPAEAWSAGVWPSIEALQEQIDARWLDVTYLEQVMEWLEQSIEAVSHLNCPGWTEYVRGYWERANLHRLRFAARHLLRILEPSQHQRNG